MSLNFMIIFQGILAISDGLTTTEELLEKIEIYLMVNKKIL